MDSAKTVIVTGASQGIGADVVRVFMERGYNIVATSLNISNAGTFQNSVQLQLVDDHGRGAPRQWRSALGPMVNAPDLIVHQRRHAIRLLAVRRVQSHGVKYRSFSGAEPVIVR